MLVCVIGNFDPEDPGHGMLAACLAASAVERAPEVRWVSPETLRDEGVLDHLQDADGIVGAPGPIESPDGYLDAIEFARGGEVPYLGIELGMDLGVVEFARTVLTIANAHSAEFDPEARDAVVVEMVPPELVKGKPSEIMGEQVVRFTRDGRMRGWIGADTSREQHRARFGVNPKMKTPLVRAGMKIAATDDTQLLIRALDLGTHPFFVLTSFAPHLGPGAEAGHPVVRAFLGAIG